MAVSLLCFSTSEGKFFGVCGTSAFEPEDRERLLSLFFEELVDGGCPSDEERSFVLAAVGFNKEGLPIGDKGSDGDFSLADFVFLLSRSDSDSDFADFSFELDEFDEDEILITSMASLAFGFDFGDENGDTDDEDEDDERDIDTAASASASAGLRLLSELSRASFAFAFDSLEAL